MKMTEKLKKYETIGACGIDCGLCPRFHTKGDSVCPGCGGLNFKAKHPSCGVLTCAIKNRFETCADCNDFPCRRFDSESTGYDSFVTHKKMFSNIESIKVNGIGQFIEKQKIRIDILSYLLTNYDDGRAKSFFCQTCALLPIDKLQTIHNEAKSTLANTELKERCKHIRKSITKIADLLDIDLKLNKKTGMLKTE
jgi:hypothetical protein